MGFENCHPAVNFLFYAATLYGSMAFNHPVFIVLSWICAFSYHIRRRGTRAVVFGLALLPLAVAFALYYSGYHHFGVTVLGQNFIGNSLTVESFLYGLTIGLRAATVCMWCGSLFQVVSSDKVVYLFGAVSPRLSLFLTIALRMIPRMKREAKRIHLARTGIGRGARQGSLLRRVGNCLRIFSMLITWLIQTLAQESDSMKSRGSLLSGRTAFSIYRFDDRDRLFVIAMFCGMTISAMGQILGVTDMYYNPRIVWNPPDFRLCITAGGFAFLCLMPLGLELWNDFRFRRARNRAFAAAQDGE